MSQSEDRHEAQRWLDTATEDLRRGASIGRGGASTPMRASRPSSGREGREGRVVSHWRADPWGHSIQALLKSFP